jgi:hypothetical protein
MPTLGDNPFALLTFIAAPAILTNASSIMSLGTSNRFARAIDRARLLSTQIEQRTETQDPDFQLRLRQLQYAERRALMLVRALTAFYASVGSFAAASLISLLGAGFFLIQQELLRSIALVIALIAGLSGVAGLVIGSLLLVRETRMTLQILSEETDQMVRRAVAKSISQPPV